MLVAAFDDTVHVLSRRDFYQLGRSQSEYEEMIDMDEIRDTAADIASDAVGDLDVPREAVGHVGDPAGSLSTRRTSYQLHRVRPAQTLSSGKALFGSTVQSIFLNVESPVATTMSS